MEPYTRSIIETFDQCPASGDAHFLEYMPFTSIGKRRLGRGMIFRCERLKGQADLCGLRAGDYWVIWSDGKRGIDGLKHKNKNRKGRDYHGFV